MPDTPEETTHDSAEHDDTALEVTGQSAQTPTAPDAAAEPAPESEPAAKREADPVLLASVDFAREALLDVTDDDAIGAFAGHTVENDNAVSLLFENLLDGYPGWFWTVTLARVDDGEPTVLESELMPGDSALLAPDWVPWSERLADYRAQQEEAAREAAEVEDDDANDDTDSDDDDSDDDTGSRLHAGDLDGVDVDELDESRSNDDPDSDSDDSHGSGDESDTDSHDEQNTSNRTGRRGSRRGGARGRRRSRGRRRT